MHRVKGLSITGILAGVAAFVIIFIPILFPGSVQLLGIPLPDQGSSLFESCAVTAFFFILAGIFISVKAGDLDNSADFVMFLYSAAFCIIGRAKGYEARGLAPGIMIVLCDAADSVAFFSGVRMIGGFISLARADKKGSSIHKYSFLTFSFITIRYISVVFGLSDFWNYTFNLTGNVTLWIVLTVFTGILIWLLKQVPRQSSLTMRAILYGFCIGFLPFLCYLLFNYFQTGETGRVYWTPVTVISLLAIPAGFLCAILQKLNGSLSRFVTRAMAGCTTISLLMSVLSLWPASSEKISVLLLFCPLLYQVICVQLEKFLHPALNAVERSLDALERTAFRCSDSDRILEVASDWLMAMLNPAFVAFYKNSENEDDRGTWLCINMKDKAADTVVLEHMLEERLNKPDAEAKLMVHRKTGFSVPMYLLHEPAGYVFLGARSETEPFSGAEIKLLTPVTRILMESMMVLDLRKQADYVSEMQNQIVFSFADMIESRDGTTGQHIKRTSTIVSLLAKNLREHNVYADKLMPVDYDMIALAAPLHDIGKIKVPDSILSKPGKLTPEEFETIKTHPVEGEKIISRTMSHIENERYLKLAREMALYHHEKWDGKGYPEGLAGEKIPVSARIMAIADVFDALCSSRSYKEAYSVSQAFAILEEYRGANFEPCLVDAMEMLKPELEKIYAGSM